MRRSRVSMTTVMALAAATVLTKLRNRSASPKPVRVPTAPDGPRVAAVLLVLAPMLLPLLPGQSAHAANIDVNTFADELTRNDGFCSLREAIMAVNMGTAYDDDCPTGDTINLSAGAYTLSIAGVGFSIPGISELDNSVGDLDITRNVTINGAGADKAEASCPPPDRQAARSKLARAN